MDQSDEMVRFVSLMQSNFRLAKSMKVVPRDEVLVRALKNTLRDLRLDYLLR